MSAPLVSVVVPIYNVEQYLPQCLDALLNQTLKDIEIICVNDGSTDNSEKIAQEYAKKDERIRYIYQENQGLSSARNTGIEVSTAPYLMFCDSDDWYDETMCEKMYQAIIQNDVALACCGTNIIYETDLHLKKSDENYYRIKFEGIQLVSSDLILNTDVSSCNKIYKRSIIKNYHLTFPSGKRYEDYCFFFRYLAVSNSVYFIQDKLYNYVRRSGSIMNTTFGGTKHAIDHLAIMSIVYDFLIKNHLFDKWEKCFYLGYLNCFYFAYHYLPTENKYQAFDVAIPFMKQIPADRIKLLSQDKQNFWNSILNKTYSSYIKRIKIGKITVAKIIQRGNKYQIKVLGIQVFAKKIKGKKNRYYVLYIPIF